MNIVVTMNMTLGKRLRSARQWLGLSGWLFRLMGVGFLAWGVLAEQGFLIGLGVFVVYPELIGLARHLFARKYGTKYIYTLHDDGIGVKTVISTLEISWAGVKNVRETSAEWVLRVSGGGVVALSKSAISVADDATLRAFLADRELIRS